MYIYIYVFTLYYALAFHSTFSSRFKSYKSLSNSRTFPQDTWKSTAAASLLFQLRGFQDLASGKYHDVEKDSWLVTLPGWRYIIQGTGNQWVQHCQESWLALVPGLRFQLGRCGLRYGDHGTTPFPLCVVAPPKKKPGKARPSFHQSVEIHTGGLFLLKD